MRCTRVSATGRVQGARSRVAVPPPDTRPTCHVGDRLPTEASAPGALSAATWSPAQWARFRAGHDCVRGPGGTGACADALQERAAVARASSDRGHLTSHTLTTTAELLQAVLKAGEDGCALVDEELETGLRSLAVPVRGHDGAVRAAINVAMRSGPHPRRVPRRGGARAARNGRGARTRSRRRRTVQPYAVDVRRGRSPDQTAAPHRARGGRRPRRARARAHVNDAAWPVRLPATQ